ncbi:unnamed protein product [Mytilus edulis]|uniref:Uncharacterized protein n=1 Tax=Mytilus edulis TaxID=6550 RepID=A0A8S3T653_MYTED|nr:unnamed protein product [Mytilus edulis]
MLVSKKTKPGEMFNHFKSLLENFPAHQNRANWQSEQYRNIVQNLPNNHAICIHDYSENYRCSERTEIQSAYFQRAEVSIHVTILNRHAIFEVDGIDSTLDSPVIVSEQFFVINPNSDHDRHYTRYVQTLISKYLKSISAEIKIMHEFTDGCSAQYKSQNCMGDVCTHRSDLGYDVLIRNYFETSHGKGPHDAAGGFLKNQADYAVHRGAINECDKTQFIGDSKRVKMIQNDNSNSEINEVQCKTNDNTIEAIVEKDMIIAVLADDVDYE